MTAYFALGCFVSGFIIAWLLRTGYVMAQVSWIQQRMEHQVRYWREEAALARHIAADALRELAETKGRTPEPPDPGAEGQEPEPRADGQEPGDG